ncbi:MAG TPA: hypothetical protein VNZ43_06915, partial [Sphingomonadaceae bacterium]|nr:hypothetical protein [Sphingomonadaceae bacterium]
PPFNTGNDRHLGHRTVANTDTNTHACTSANSADHRITARRPPPEGYGGKRLDCLSMADQKGDSILPASVHRVATFSSERACV